MSQTLAPGTLLHHDTYRILKVLGCGGFGITYLALDLNLDRQVAIKEFFPKDYCDRNDTSHVTVGSSSVAPLVTRLKAKFLKEARNIAKLEHAGIIKIHAAFEENDTAYYVMEYIDGMSLYEYIRRNNDRPLPPDTALSIIDQVAAALRYVHSKGINHLDIKPGNIMWNPVTRWSVLIDFGLSKQYDSDGNQTSSTPPGISSGYAPLEQYKDGGVSEFAPQTDIYALGATLYFLLTGIRPPQAADLIETPLTFPMNVPARFKAPILHAMSPRRADRPATVDIFLAELNDTTTSASDDTVTIHLDATDNTRTEDSPYAPKSNRTNDRPASTYTPKSDPLHPTTMPRSNRISRQSFHNPHTNYELPSMQGGQTSFGKNYLFLLLATLLAVAYITLDDSSSYFYMRHLRANSLFIFLPIVLGSIATVLIYYNRRDRLFNKGASILKTIFIIFIAFCFSAAAFKFYGDILYVKYSFYGDRIDTLYDIPIRSLYIAGTYSMFFAYLCLWIVCLIKINLSAESLAYKYVSRLNEYNDALENGKQYEIEKAESDLKQYFARQNQIIANSKRRYEFQKYLDEHNIPFATSLADINR